MPVMKCWLFHILLDYILVLRPVYLARVKLLLLLLSGWVGIRLSSFNALFDFEVLVHVFSVFVALLVQGYS